jgi:hypothetical protein
MEDLAEIALTIATGLFGLFLIIHVTARQNDALVVVSTGVIGGQPTTTEYRWLWLLQVFLGMAIAILVLDFFLLFSFLTIARAVSERVQTLAYLGAAMAAFAFLTQLLWGTWALITNVSLLRQAAKDST